MLGVQGGHHLTREAAVQTVLGRPLQAREWSGGRGANPYCQTAPHRVFAKGPSTPHTPLPPIGGFGQTEPNSFVLIILPTRRLVAGTYH